MPENHHKTMSAAFGSALVIIGLLAGVGASQLTVVGQVNRTEADVKALAKSDELMRQDLIEERRRNDDRIKSAVDMMGRIADQNTRLITLLERQLAKP